MAKSYNNLFDSIVNHTSLDNALDRVLIGRREYTEHSIYDLRRERNIGKLLLELEDGIWVPGKPRTFRLFIPKQRDIQAPQFIDRIVHHAICDKVEHLFVNKYIKHSYACIKGRGAQGAVYAVQKMLRSHDNKFKNPYVLQTDISKYFDSINHDILIEEFFRTIRCKPTRMLYESIIRANNDNGTGIPVGALTSQLSANINLNIVDQRMVNHHRFGSYVRYMDDVVILCESKAHAKEAYDIMSEECSRIKLSLNPKSEYYPTRRGVDFVGYRTFYTHILPRKRIINNLRDSLNEMRDQYNSGLIDFSYIRPKIASHLGYASHCRSMNTINSLIREFLYSLNCNGSNAFIGI